jgi:dTDP-4-amino-4,6-dideoxy-D-galactose acyltransferase
MNSLLKFLAWDTEFFGYRIGKIFIENNISSTLLVRSIQEARLSGLELVYLSLPHDNKELNSSAGRFSAKHVDNRVTFFMILDRGKIHLLHPKVLKYEHKEPTEELLDLAVQIGAYSRYKKDERFSYSQFERLYKTWMMRSVKKELAREVFVFKDNESIKGVITLDIKKKVGIIDLMGVDAGCRRQNIGFELINAAKRYFLEQNINRIEVVTQGANVAACNLYKKCGFDVLSVKNFYHLWLA